MSQDKHILFPTVDRNNIKIKNFLFEMIRVNKIPICPLFEGILHFYFVCVCASVLFVCIPSIGDDLGHIPSFRRRLKIIPQGIFPHWMHSNKFVDVENRESVMYNTNVPTPNCHYRSGLYSNRKNATVDKKMVIDKQ